MKGIFGLILVGLMLLTVPQAAIAQKDPVRDADRAFTAEKYSEAKELYKKAYPRIKKSKDKAKALFQIGECYREMQDPIQAEVWYRKAVAGEYEDPIGVYYIAEALRMQGKYDEAIVEYNNFIAVAPAEQKVLGENGVAASQKAVSWEKNPSRYEVNAEVLLNSPKFDFAPTFADKKLNSLIFTSSREASIGGEDANYGENFSDLYVSERDKKGKWSVPVPLVGGVNTEANEGGAALSEKMNSMFFTRCEVVKKKSKGCEIWQSKRQGKNWGPAELIDLGTDDTATVGHPIPLKKDQVLLFASDHKGGYGGKDLWYSTYNKKEKRWDPPVNLGPDINTPQDEMYPFVRLNGEGEFKGALYFASSGHQGMGGLDIFKAVSTGDMKWGKVENMGAPINSSADDFALVYEGNRDRGFFTSSRSGGKGGDDIYNFHLPPIIFKLEGDIMDVESKEKLAGATIKLVGTDGTSVEVKSDELGHYVFDVKENGRDRYLQENTSYTIEVNGKDLPNGHSYLKSSGQETTVGVDESTVFIHDFELQCSDCGEITFPSVLYDLGKWALQVNDKVNSKDSLDYLYTTLIENPTIVIELAAHTDSRGRDQSNLILSQKRAKSCVDYLVEKGINPQRMIPKGYGEKQLKVTDAQINALPSKEEQEAGHQKNRRTVFRVLRDDFVPPEDAAPATPE